MSTNTHETLQNTTLGVATRAIHAGQTPDPTTGAVVTPIFMTSTFKQDGVGEMRNGYDYSRSVNPTRTAFDEQLAAVEGGAYAMSFASGLAAIDVLLRSTLRPGDNVLIGNDVYGGTYRLLAKVFVPWGIGLDVVDITDPAQTFEELRIAKSDDFPELGEGKRVSWSVEYGKVTKAISDPKGTTIASVKSEIETSKAFLDNLKKAKDKNPDCLVKPKVTAQSKGIAAYKGVFASLEEARASDKTICLFPSGDGRVYELRKTELGEFIAPKDSVIDLGSVRAGFPPALPLVPMELLAQIISFFRCCMSGPEEFEALAHIFWDKQEEKFVAHIPKQRVTKAHIDADLTQEELPEDRYLHYIDIHSHNSMEAKFSRVDDEDERATRIYIVVGRLDKFFPDVTVRMSCGGTYLTLPPGCVLESFGGVFPAEWRAQVTLLRREALPVLRPMAEAPAGKPWEDRQ